MIIVPIVALYKASNKTILLSKRPPGKPLAGLYEYPGGKCESNERPCEALSRELTEELGIMTDVEDLTPITFTDFRFDGKIYTLLMYFCEKYSGEPYGREGQEIFEIPVNRLSERAMPPANTALTTSLIKFLENYSEKQKIYT